MAERIYNLTEVAKRVREQLKEKFPKLTFSVSKDGNSLYVYLMKGNFEAINQGEENPLQINHYYIDRDSRITDKAKDVLKKAKEIAQQYNWNNSDPMTDYFDVNFYLNMGIGKYGKPYEMTSKPSSTSTFTPRPSKPTTQFDKGELLKDCAGWQIFKKTLNDGRIVYGAYKKSETKPNKENWNDIKGEIYVETGFKWGKFGNFEKWGLIASEDFVIGNLCKILDKYYKDEAKPQEIAKPEEVAKPEDEIKVGTIFKVATEVGGKRYTIKSVDEYGVFIGAEGYDWTTEFSKKEAILNFKEGRWIKVGQEEVEEKPIEEVPQTPEDEIKIGTLFAKMTDVNAVIYKILDVTDEYFNIGKVDDDSFGFYPKEEVIKNFKDGTWVKVDEVGSSDYPNESYKELPANPKLEYCKIIWAEGLIKYADTFPREFQSFTALTKYIADNIGELPENGYDKHKVEWKWKFETEIHTDRWDVSKNEANPFKYPNLYAFEKLTFLCYMAWSTEGISSGDAAEEDFFYAERLGKDGLELTNRQFDEMLYGFLTYYPNDPKRFKYNDPQERLRAFIETYPKLSELFRAEEEKPAPSKEKIEKAIKGLQYLADKGNENAIKAIKGLKYLLNK